MTAATGNILPPSKDSKTLTELAELCMLTQVATREKLEELRSYLENEGYTVTSPRSNNSKQGYSAAKNAFKSSPTLDRKNSRTKATGQVNVFGLTYEEDAGEPSLPLVTNIGGPLESVIEAEYETDGMTTPGSVLESPFFSSAQRRKNTSVTPSLSARKTKNRRKSSSFALRSPVTPPTFDKLRISDSTNELLLQTPNDENHINENNLGTEVSKSVSRPVDTPNRSQEEQQHLYEFREEDDMITLDTTINKDTTLCSPQIYGGTTSEKMKSFEEERSQFFARMEGILERVEETLMDESQSPMSYDQDDDDDSINPNINGESSQALTSRKDVDKQYERSIISVRSNDGISSRSNRYEEATFNEDDELSGSRYSRDSTNMVATQVAGKDGSKSDIKPFGISEDKSVYSINHQRPTHILVDSGLASPAHTNITMDATFLSDVNESSLVRREEHLDTRYRGQSSIVKYAEEDDDNLSTVTPVLDRYRLDPSDGSSSGLKVVPNKRSAHRSNKKRTPTPRREKLPTIAQLSPSLDHILHARTPKREFTDSDFISPRATTSEHDEQNYDSITPTVRATKVYRKTPFRKRNPFDVEDDEDENHDPNIGIGYSQKSHGAFSIAVPPLRHSSIEPNRTDFLEKHRRHAYLQDETDTIQKIDETIDRIDIELSD